MGGLLTDYSGFYQAVFGTTHIDAFEATPRVAQSVYISFKFLAEGTPEIIEGGQSYVLDCESKEITAGTQLSPYVDLSDLLPNNEYRLSTTFKGYTLGVRGKLEYFYYSYYYRLGWKLYFTKSKTVSDIDEFFEKDFSNLGQYSTSFIEYGGTSLQDDTVKLKSIDFSQFYANETTNTTWGVSGVSTVPLITFEKNDGTEKKVPAEGRFYYLLEASNYLWDNVPGPEPADNKGRWKGLPTSTIPIRSTIRGGVDYRHNIDVFDETNYAARNMFLTNRVGTMPYELVRFTYPNGTIKCNTNLQFTHFICCSFTDDNNPRVYRITTYRVISPSVIEYDFTLDYMKDYWQHWGVTSTNAPLVLRTTDNALWENKVTNMIPDTAICSGYTRETYFTLATLSYAHFPTESQTAGPWVLLSLVSGEVITLSYANYVTSFKPTVERDIHGAIIASQISGIHLIPPHSAITGMDTAISSYTFSGVDSEGAAASVTVTFLDAYKYSPGNNRVQCTVYIPKTDIYEDWFGMSSEWRLTIPFYGEVTPTRGFLQDVISDAGAQIGLIIDPQGGNVSVNLSAYDGIYSQWNELPSLPIPSNANNYLAIQSLNNDYNASVTQSAMAIGGGVVSMVGGVATANPMLMAGGAAIASGVVSAYKAQEAYTIQREELRNNSYPTYTGGGGSASLAQNKIVLKRIQNDLLVDLEAYYDAVGYPTQKLWEEIGATSGKRYWISFLGTLKGTTEYVEACRTDIERDCLIYNY